MLEIALGVILFTGIVIALVFIIVGAKSKLVPSGDVEIVINNEKTIRVPVGAKLLSALADQGLFVPSACGGGGTCAQCKVKIHEGGGEILATETSHITKREAAEGDRLSCQVTVKQDMKIHVEEDVFGVKTVTYRNTELIYSDDIGEAVADMGFKTMLTEGAKHVLGWKSPNYLYQHPRKKNLKLLLKNFSLSDDIAFRFSTQDWDEWPLTTDKYLHWLKEIKPEEEVVNLYMDYETFGEHQWAETGIFDFMRVLPTKIIEDGEFTFNTPSELSKKLKPVSDLHVPNPISWADEERDLSAWLGNEMQDEAFEKLNAMIPQMQTCKDKQMNADWLKLQTSDHFYYMCTKWFADGDVHEYFNPYASPFEAFINYMNVLSDFKIRLDDYSGKNKKSVKRIKK